MKLNWGKAIVIFFIIFLSLAATFIVFSFRQNNDLVESDYYEKGAAYSKQIEINERSAIYIDSVQILNSHENIDLFFCKSISSNTSVISVFFYRPSEKKDDYTISIDPKQDECSIEKSHLKKGRYIVKLSWVMDSMDYGLEKNVFVE